MKKIVFFTSSLNIGGIEKVFLTYANSLANIGYDVSYLICYKNNNLTTEINDKVNLLNLQTNKLRKSFFKLIQYFKEKQPDIVFVANNATLIIYLAKLFSHSKVKIIASHHNYMNIDVNSFIEKKCIWSIYNKCYSIIAISEGIYSYLIAKGVKKEKLRLIYNPIDIGKTKSLAKSYNIEEDNFILFVGRLSKVKNIPLLISAFKLLNAKNNSIKLIIIGEGPELKKLETLTNEKKLNSSIYFKGVKTNPYPYISKAKVLALSSFSEAFPTVLLEALSLGTTIVSTPTKGSIEILENGKLGYLTQSFTNEIEYAHLLETAIKIPKSPQVLQEYAYKYNVDIIIKETEKIWK